MCGEFYSGRRRGKKGWLRTHSDASLNWTINSEEGEKDSIGREKLPPPRFLLLFPLDHQSRKKYSWNKRTFDFHELGKKSGNRVQIREKLCVLSHFVLCMFYQICIGGEKF